MKKRFLCMLIGASVAMAASAQEREEMSATDLLRNLPMRVSVSQLKEVQDKSTGKTLLEETETLTSDNEEQKKKILAMYGEAPEGVEEDELARKLRSCRQETVESVTQLLAAPPLWLESLVDRWQSYDIEPRRVLIWEEIKERGPDENKQRKVKALLYLGLEGSENEVYMNLDLGEDHYFRNYGRDTWRSIGVDYNGELEVGRCNFNSWDLRTNSSLKSGAYSSDDAPIIDGLFYSVIRILNPSALDVDVMDKLKNLIDYETVVPVGEDQGFDI